MKHKLLLLYTWFIRTIFFFIPDMPFTMCIRGFFYGLGMKRCGKNFQVTNDVWLKGLESITIGDNVFIGNSTIFLSSGDIVVGNNVLIGPHCILVSGNHIFKNGSYNNSDSCVGSIEVQDNSWIGGNCTLTPGAKLSARSVLGANSFLNRDTIEEQSLFGGVPAKFIKKMC